MNSIIESITSSTNQSKLDFKTKKVQTTTFFRMLLLFSFLFSMQCVMAQPTITSFTPTSGNIGASVSLTGTGFNTTAANNIVFFGATRATVSAATATSLTVTVPIGATFAPITILNSGTSLAAYSNKFFNPTFSPNKGSITGIDIAAKVDFATGSNPVSIAIGDIDGDGKPDLVLANYDSDTVSVLRNTGNSGSVSFATKVDFTTGANPQSVAIGDIDGDGKPDLAIVNTGSSSTVSVLRNTGTSGVISFATKLDFTLGSNSNTVVIGDLDGDGKPDLASANRGNNNVSILRNTGSSGTISFATKVDFGTGGLPRSLTIGDIDGDGKLDLATANSTSSSSVSVLRNTGSSGTVSFATKVDFTTGSFPQSIVIGDLDGDGKVDLATDNYGSSGIGTSISVFRNTSSSGTVSFATKVDFTTGTGPYSLAIGDIDGDGKPDLSIVNYISISVSVLRNTCSSGIISFATKVDFATSNVPRSVAIGDINGDGKPDLAIANMVNNSVSILRNNPQNQVTPTTISSINPTSGTVGDSVSISGTGFNNILSNNIVFFGATRAIVTAATDTSLKVIVPNGATFAPITVVNSITTLAVNSTQYFNPIFTPNKGSITTVDIGRNIGVGTTGTDPRIVVIGDIDGDGKPDLVIANKGSNTISVLRNRGSSSTITFDFKLDFTTGSNPESLAIGDINGDGKPDLVSVNYGVNSTVSVLRNTSSSGSVSFAPKEDFTTGSSSNSVAIGDINGDGKPDLVIVNGNNSVSVLRNMSSSGMVSFATKIDFTTGQNPKKVVIGDIDGDGKLDLAITNGSGSSVSILRNTGISNSVSFATKIDFGTGTNPSSVAIGEIDGDGKPDLAIANQNSNNVSVLRNTSSIGIISFATKVDFATGDIPYSVAIGDIDGDDKPDLAIANFGSYTVSVLRNSGSSGTISFATKVDYGISTRPHSIAIGDMDGDSKPELATVTNDNFAYLFYNKPRTQTTISSLTPSNGMVGTSVSIKGTGFNTIPANNIIFFGATRATVTAATDTSLTVTVPTGATFAPITVLNTSTTLAAYSTQFFNPIFSPNKGSITTTDIAAKVDFTTALGPFSVAIGDIDGDGKPDLAIANSSNSSVSILRNTGSNGNVTFATKVDFTIGTTPRSVAIGDINGDGKPDLAIGNFGSDNISILRNTGSVGTVSFATKVDFATGLEPYSVSFGDIDGDGRPDLVIANSMNNSISVFRNTTESVNTISFATKLDLVSGTRPKSIAIGDLDADGKPDLAIANYSSNTVSVLRNTSSSVTGVISFTTKVDFITGINPVFVAIGDIDMDGKLDLAIANDGSNTVSALRNTCSVGNISFATKVDFTTGSQPSSLAFGDIDGDGKPDLAITNGSGISVSILRNTGISGTVSFATKVDFTTGSIPYSVVIGDINGDGKPDLAIANYSSNTVSILRNSPQPADTIIIIGTLPTFTSCAGTASAQQSFAVNGVGLTANVLVSAPTGFEVSTTSGAGFGTSVSLIPISGTINNVPVFVRLKSLVSGSLNGNIVCTTTGFPTKNVAVNGIVKATSLIITNASICPSSLPYSWNGRTYNTTKTDTIFYTNSVGCDSLFILKLIVKQVSSSTNNFSICPNALPYSWNGLTFITAGTQTKTGLTNSVGCDSSATLNLTVKPTSTSTNNISICSSLLPYSWNGLTFNTGGTQTKTGLTNSVGCDSSATLNLTVNPSPATSNITGKANTAKLDTATYSVSGLSGSVFNWIVSGATIQSGAGSNKVQVKWSTTGTQLVNVTETSNQGCIGTQKTLSVIVSPTIGMNELKASNQVIIYPNPFSETIHITLLNNLKLEKAIIYDLVGNEIINSNKNEIDAGSLKSGIYLIMIVDNIGNSYNQKLIKN